MVEISRMHKTGRPVLVGTTSVEQSEALSQQLRDAGILHQVRTHSRSHRFSYWIAASRLYFTRIGLQWVKREVCDLEMTTGLWI